MNSKDLFERALRGDLDATEACVTEARRGAFSSEEMYRLLLCVQEIKERSKSFQYRLQQQLARCDLLWYSSNSWSTWHIRNPWKRSHTLCGKGPYEVGVNGVEENPTPEKAFYYKWTDEKGNPVPCGTCMNKLPDINAGTRNNLMDLWTNNCPPSVQEQHRRRR